MTESSPDSSPNLRVAYVPMKYPVLSQTFIQREVKGLMDNDIDVVVMPVFSIGVNEKEGEGRREPILQVKWWEVPLGFILLLWNALLHPVGAAQGLGFLVAGPPRNFESWIFAIWGTAFACLRKSQIQREGFDRVHAAWATAPATAVSVLSRLTGLPYSFGAHAYDVYRDGGDNFLKPKLRQASFIHTTTQANVDYLSSLVSGEEDLIAEKILLARRGLVKLPEFAERREFHDPVRLICVGRLVPKKAHHYQLAACAELKKREIPFELHLVGDGPLKEEIAATAEALEIIESIFIHGALSQEDTQVRYRESDIFWHTGIVAPDGDRDGLPNVVPEALALGLPVISSPTAGVNEAVLNTGTSEDTGLVVDVSDPVVLANAVERMINEPELRLQMAQAGRRWVENHFVAADNTRKIAGALRGNFPN